MLLPYTCPDWEPCPRDLASGSCCAQVQTYSLFFLVLNHYLFAYLGPYLAVLRFSAGGLEDHTWGKVNALFCVKLSGPEPLPLEPVLVRTNSACKIEL